MANEEVVWFNGSDKQPKGKWTTNENITIPWPSPSASLKPDKEMAWDKKTDGQWFAGTLVSQRVAPIDNLTGFGSGSYETFSIELNEKSDITDDENTDLIFNCCKTAYRPYDLAVTAVLIAFKHYFPESKISSDGEAKDWLDAQFLCNNLLGYGMDFQLEE